MERVLGLRSFKTDDAELVLDTGRSILLCRGRDEGGRKRWAKKLDGSPEIICVLEDGERFYLACETGETNGQFLALDRETGSTRWFIPGRSFMHVLFDGFLYLIFVDGEDRFYLLKVDREEGRTLWHHRVEEDLQEYVFTGNELRLSYGSGRGEKIRLADGRLGAGGRL